MASFPFVVTALLLSSFSLLSDEAQPARVGERIPDHEWKTLLGHDGRTRLRELIGQPVIVAGYRNHLVDGIHASLVGSEMLSKYEKDGLLLVMENRVGWGRDSVEPAAFWLRTAGWMPWLTPSPPDDPKIPDLPIVRTAPRDTRSLVVIGVDGTLVAEGTVELATAPERKSDYRAQVRLVVKKEVARRKAGWGADSAARAARAIAFGQGRLAEALARLSFDGKTDVPERDDVRQELEWRFSGQVKSARFFLAEGRPREATDVLERLAASVRGVDRWEAEIAPLLEEIGSPETKRDRDLEQKLDKIIAPLDRGKKSGKLEPAILADLREFAAKNKGTRVGARAEKLVPLTRSLLATFLGLKVQTLEERAANPK